MVLVADLFSGLLAFVFGSAAIGKLVRQRQQVQTAEKLRIASDRFRWIAAPYHGLPSATSRNPRQRFGLVRAVLAVVPVATGCDRLRPLGSIKDPSSVAKPGYGIAAEILDPTIRRFSARGYATRWAAAAAAVS
jgi:hypothetical protein